MYKQSTYASLLGHWVDCWFDINIMKRTIGIFLLLSAFSLTAISQVFRFVVAADGSGTHSTIQAAVDAAPNNERSIIYIKKGIYNEKVMVGSHSVVSNKILSFIGEDAEQTIIRWDDYNGKSITYDGRTVTSGTPQSATLTVNSVDFYAENISIQNTNDTRQAVALYNVADRQTFKNCRLLGFQDTHYSRKARRSYFYNSYIEGTTDYICAGGTVIFDNCSIKSLKNGSYITAPEDITAFKTVEGKKYYYGFVFRNCTLNSDPGIEVFLGRPWQGTSSSVFINTKMANIKPAGWSVWSGNNHLSSFFAEFNSTDLNSNPLDVSQRATWSHQLTAQEIADHYTNEQIYNSTNGAYDPFSIVIAPAAPLQLQRHQNELSWQAVEGVVGYLVSKNNQFYSTTVNTNAAIVGNEADVFTVRAVGAYGQLSLPASLATSAKQPVSTISMRLENKRLIFSEPVICSVYSVDAKLIAYMVQARLDIDLPQMPLGPIIVKYSDAQGRNFQQALINTHN